MAYVVEKLKLSLPLNLTYPLAAQPAYCSLFIKGVFLSEPKQLCTWKRYENLTNVLKCEQKSQQLPKARQPNFDMKVFRSMIQGLKTKCLFASFEANHQTFQNVYACVSVSKKKSTIPPKFQNFPPNTNICWKGAFLIHVFPPYLQVLILFRGVVSVYLFAHFVLYISYHKILSFPSCISYFLAEPERVKVSRWYIAARAPLRASTATDP